MIPIGFPIWDGRPYYMYHIIVCLYVWFGLVWFGLFVCLLIIILYPIIFLLHPLISPWQQLHFLWLKPGWIPSNLTMAHMEVKPKMEVLNSSIFSIDFPYLKNQPFWGSIIYGTPICAMGHLWVVFDLWRFTISVAADEETEKGWPFVRRRIETNRAQSRLVVGCVCFQSMIQWFIMKHGSLTMIIIDTIVWFVMSSVWYNHYFQSCMIHYRIIDDNYWLVASNMNFIFHFIYGIILPIDVHIFQDG